MSAANGYLLVSKNFPMFAAKFQNIKFPLLFTSVKSLRNKRKLSLEISIIVNKIIQILSRFEKMRKFLPFLNKEFVNFSTPKGY